MYVAFNTILEIFLLIGLGVVCCYRGVFSQADALSLNKIIYNLFFPALIFNTIATMNILNFKANASFFFVYVLSFIILVAASFILGKYQKRYNLQNATLFSLNASTSNTAYIGLPLFIGLFEQKGTAMIALTVVVISCMIIPLSILLLNLGSSKIKLKESKIIIKIFKDPVVMAAFSGLLVSIFNINLPHSLQSSASLVAKACIPAMLIYIGMSLWFALPTLKCYNSAVITAVFMKLVAHPIIAFLIIVIFNIEDTMAYAAVIIAALPTIKSVCTISQRFKVFEVESIHIVVLTTLLGLMTLPLFISALYFFEKLQFY